MRMPWVPYGAGKVKAPRWGRKYCVSLAVMGARTPLSLALTTNPPGACANRGLAPPATSTIDTMAHAVTTTRREVPRNTQLLLRPMARSNRVGYAASSQDARRRDNSPVRVRSASAVLSHLRPVRAVEKTLRLSWRKLLAGGRARGGPSDSACEYSDFSREFAHSCAARGRAMQIQITNSAAKRSES